MFVLRFIQYVGFIGAQITNIILLFLICTKAERLFGNYRFFMCTFALHSLIYSWIEILTQPIVHTKGPVSVVIMDSPMKYEEWIGNEITCLYCASFALCISLLAAQFVFRFIVVCSPQKIFLIEGIRVFLLFIPCILCFVVWYLFVHFGMQNTIEKQNYLKDVFEKVYNEDSTKVSFIAIMYWSMDQNGEKHWKLEELFSAMGCTFIIASCFSVIVISAIKTHYKMKDFRLTMSHRTREMNRQLFITSTLQTALPLFMMYSPVGIVMSFPMFGLEVGRLANFIGASLAIYPSIEPLISIVFIREFRNTILCRRRNHVESYGKPNSVNSKIQLQNI